MFSSFDAAWPRRRVQNLLTMIALVLWLPCLANAMQIFVTNGSDVPEKLRARIPQLLAQVPNAKVTTLQSGSEKKPQRGSIVFSFGEHPLTRWLIPTRESIGPEGFIVRSRVIDGILYIAADGKPAHGERTSIKLNRGLMFAAYEALQKVGFRFFNPFTPTVPRVLRFSNLKDTSESPRWPLRGLHLHTQHPLELTHVLNGWGKDGPQDQAGFESLLPEWDLFCEWMIAHRQNQIQWVLLADKLHVSFNDSPDRIARLKQLVKTSHAWGLLTGIDIGVVFEQQNMWHLVRGKSKPQEETAEIKTRLKWLMQAGWDFVTVEMGSTEFTAPNENKMLGWMNLVTAEMEDVYKRPAAVKVHVSGGQKTKNFKDPQTGEPLNFNFLPYYADKRLIVLPHTVQLYSLDDQAPTYGNKDFSEIQRFLRMTMGQRPVLFYPEAAYWVSYDVDVPLFLPLYAERRLRDLRLIAKDENTLMRQPASADRQMQGQILFSSGFEWGYWLANVVAMRAAWNPYSEIENDLAAFDRVLQDIFDPTVNGTSELIAFLTETVSRQKDLLIDGRFGTTQPKHIERRSGIAYLSGVETWDEINTTLHDVYGVDHAATQPHRFSPRVLRKKLESRGVHYLTDVRPLLSAMKYGFADLSNKISKLSSQNWLDSSLRDVVNEFEHGTKINALRSTQVFALYEAAAAKVFKADKTWKAERLNEAQRAVDEAAAIVRARELSYSVDPDRIAGWGVNPTVYRYGYLWTARSLFFWYRDEGLVTKTPKTPCFMNIVNPADIAFSEGQKNIYYKLFSALNKTILFGMFKGCLKPSKAEPDPLAVRR